MNSIKLFVVALTVFVTSCASVKGTREPIWPYPDDPRTTQGPQTYPDRNGQVSRGEPRPATETERDYSLGSPRPLESDYPTQTYPRTAAEISGPAVISLINQAKAERDSGRFDAAGATLERALRIEPRNAFVWLDLAKTRLAANDTQQAQSTARRADSYGRSNPFISKDAWLIIAQALEIEGDALGAQQARERADQFARASY